MGYSASQPNLLSLKRVSSERRLPLTFWVGAGASRDAGLPTWLGLRDQLIKEALETLLTLEEQEAASREAKLENAAQVKSLWKAFETIKGVMGEATYREAVRSRFENSEALNIPEIYDAIWGMPNVVGLLNLNIDGLANRSHRRIRPTEDVISFTGRQAKNFAHLISRRKPFIGNLHGIHQDYSSWVFTTKEINSLLKDDGYVKSIDFILSNTCIIFLGISADDSAAGGLLENLTQKGIDAGTHYWITDRRDAATDAWSNNAGLLPIRYSVENGETHTSVLLSIVNDIKAYQSFDTKAPVVVPKISAIKTRKSVKDLRLLDDDALRIELSGYAKELIDVSNGKTDTTEYKDFLRQYSPSIHQAWHVTDESPYNNFFDYEVLKRISSGPFSSVWKLKNREGEFAALKVIQTDNLQDGAQLESFRRGVQSLRIMSEAAIPGVARLLDAYEIPTAVIMEFVDGSTLPEVVNRPEFRFWSEGIKIIKDLCQKIDMAHRLPQGVLHRDIRPSNIMLPYYYWGDAAQDAGVNNCDISILNYDMSWHKDASGRTISGNLQEAGYYAPEQLENREGELARSAAVDSYGVGMTLYFAATKLNPPIGGSKASEWPDFIRNIRKDRNLTWISAVNRMKRLVVAATSIDPQVRPSVAAIRAELELIEGAMEGTEISLTPDAWAEELFCRAVGEEYETSGDGNRFERSVRKGRVISISGSSSTDSIDLIFRNIATDGTDWTQVKKSWSAKLATSKEILKSSGWEILPETRYSSQEIHLFARIHTLSLVNKIASVVDGLTRSLDAVRLD